MAKITVLGSGGWGTALAISAYNCGHEVYLWSPFEQEVNDLIKNRENVKLLPDINIPDEINITCDINCVDSSLITIIACPSVAVRSVAKQLSYVQNHGIVVNVAKGFEKESLKRLSEVIREELPDDKICVLSGPSHAEEVARMIPTSLVASSKSFTAASIVQDVLSSEFLRIYTANDMVGVELGGAIKNVIAVCAGISDGLGLGDNTKAALITRGLSEMANLGVCMGADERTFMGLTGIGDLVVTCTSKHSRNNRFGYKVGSGVAVEQALKEVGTVEGYYATLMAYQLGKKYGVELPIINSCYKVLYEGYSADLAVNELMTRPKGKER